MERLQDHSSTYEFIKGNETISNEMHIAMANKKMIRERLKECVRENGVNANENCYELRIQFASLIKDRLF